MNCCGCGNAALPSTLSSLWRRCRWVMLPRASPFHVCLFRHLGCAWSKQREKQRAKLCHSWIWEGAKAHRDESEEPRSARTTVKKLFWVHCVPIFYRAAAQGLGFTCPVKSKKPSECRLWPVQSSIFPYFRWSRVFTPRLTLSCRRWEQIHTGNASYRWWSPTRRQAVDSHQMTPVIMSQC